MSKIYIHGEINDETYVKFSRQLSRREAAVKLSDNIIQEIELISDGGSALSAMAFYDRIRRSSLHVNITATGFVASAAVLILAAGDCRRMTKNAWVMVHEDTTGSLKGLLVTDAEREIKQLRILENQWNKLLAEVTKISAREWERLNINTTYLTPQECLSYGLIEEIV